MNRFALNFSIGSVLVCGAGLSGCSFISDVEGYHSADGEGSDVADGDSQLQEGRSEGDNVGSGNGTDGNTLGSVSGTDTPGEGTDGDTTGTDGSTPGEGTDGDTTGTDGSTPGDGSGDTNTGGSDPEPTPVVLPPPTVPSCLGQLISFDDIYELVQNDILSQDVEDRPFTRYLLLTNRYNQGICSDELDDDRFGMDKMLNMLSIETRVRQAFPINADETIYRIDIRDYGWDREVDVVGVSVFDDGWEAIVEQNLFAVEFEGDEAEQVILQAETNTPWMYSDSLIDVAALGNLYYALIGVDVNNTLDDFIFDGLGIDVIDNLDQERLLRAGTTESAVSRQERVAERHDLEVRQGAFWQSFDVNADNPDNAGGSIFNNPLGFAEGGREAIFTLQNGFLAYIVADENDVIVDRSDILSDTLENGSVARVSVSCSGCHAQGLLPMIDEVRAVVELNQFNFDADEFELVQGVYPTPAQFTNIIENDSASYQSSLAQAGIPTSGSDPMQNTFLRFDADLRLVNVAGELGVSVELFQANIALVDPQLQVVSSGATTIDRDDFSNLYLASLCVMQTLSQNQPLVSACAAATAQLDN